jgi:predicted RNA binding protein YcfA (HicA-like mRNA interferase family)
MNKQKLLKKALANPKNIRFGDMLTLVEAFGFRLARIRGSHHIFADVCCSRAQTSPADKGTPKRSASMVSTWRLLRR